MFPHCFCCGRFQRVNHHSGKGTTKEMKEGSVIVDMNTDTGGNIVGSKEGEIIEKDGVTIVGIPMLCRTVPNTASML